MILNTKQFTIYLFILRKKKKAGKKRKAGKKEFCNIGQLTKKENLKSIEKLMRK